VNILVNNAGMARQIKLEDIAEADWDEHINVNLKSAFLVTQAVLPQMRAQRWGGSSIFRLQQRRPVAWWDPTTRRRRLGCWD